MGTAQFSSGDPKLLKAAAEFLRQEYGKKPKSGEQLTKGVTWSPSLLLRLSKDFPVAAEVSQLPYPEIFRLNHAKVLASQEPIRIFCVCPEEVFLDPANQNILRELASHGYGVISVDRNGITQKRIECIPLIHCIGELEFNQAISQLPGAAKARIKQCYVKYRYGALDGVTALTEYCEDLINISVLKAVKKGILKKGIEKDKTAEKLDAMIAEPKFSNAMAAIGGMRSYIKTTRNLSHHPARNLKERKKKFGGCKHAFKDGISKIEEYIRGIKNSVNIGIS